MFSSKKKDSEQKRIVADDLFAKKKYHHAIIYYSDAISHWEDNACAYISRGNVFYEVKFYLNAIADWQRAIKVNPEFKSSYETWINKATDLGKEELVLDSDVETCIFNGDTFFVSSDLYHAVELYNKALEFDANNIIAHFNRGKAYQMSGMLDYALSDFNFVLRIDPDFYPAYSGCMLCNNIMGNFQQGQIDHQNYESVTKKLQKDGRLSKYSDLNFASIELHYSSIFKKKF